MTTEMERSYEEALNALEVQKVEAPWKQSQVSGNAGKQSDSFSTRTSKSSGKKVKGNKRDKGSKSVVVLDRRASLPTVSGEDISLKDHEVVTLQPGVIFNEKRKKYEIRIPAKGSIVDQCKDLVTTYGFRYRKDQAIGENKHAIDAVARSVATAYVLRMLTDRPNISNLPIVDLHGSFRSISPGKYSGMDVIVHRQFKTTRDLCRYGDRLTVPTCQSLMGIDLYDLTPEEIASALRHSVSRTMILAIRNLTGLAGLNGFGAYFKQVVGSGVATVFRVSPSDSSTYLSSDAGWVFDLKPIRCPRQDGVDYLNIVLKRQVDNYFIFELDLVDGCPPLKQDTVGVSPPMSLVTKVRGPNGYLIDIIDNVIPKRTKTGEKGKLDDHICREKTGNAIDQHPDYQAFKRIMYDGNRKYINSLEMRTLEIAPHLYRAQSVFSENQWLKKLRYVDFVAKWNDKTWVDRGTSSPSYTQYLFEELKHKFSNEFFSFKLIILSIFLAFITPYLISYSNFRSVFVRMNLYHGKGEFVQALYKSTSWFLPSPDSIDVSVLTGVFNDTPLEYLTSSVENSQSYALIIISIYFWAFWEETVKRVGPWWTVPVFEILCDFVAGRFCIELLLFRLVFHFVTAKIPFIVGFWVHSAWNTSIFITEVLWTRDPLLPLSAVEAFITAYYNFDVEQIKTLCFSHATTGTFILQSVDCVGILPIPDLVRDITREIYPHPEQSRGKIFHMFSVLSPLYRPNQSLVNMVQAFRARILVRNPYPAPPELWRSFAKKFSKLVTPSIPGLPLSVYLDKMKLSARLRIERAIRNRLRGISGDLVNLEFMVKADELIGLKECPLGYDLKPRAICCVNPEVQLRLQESVRNTFAGICEFLWREVITWNGKMFQVIIPYGFTSQDLTTFMRDAELMVRGDLDYVLFVFGDDGCGVGPEGWFYWDMSHNDRSHVPCCQLPIIHQIRKNFPDEADFLERVSLYEGVIKSRPYKNQGRVYSSFKKSVIIEDGEPTTLSLCQLGSGLPHTSATNSVGNGICGMEVLSSFPDDPVKGFQTLGFKAKYFHCGSSRQFEFLKLMPAPTIDGSFVMLPFPSRIAKLGKVLTSPNVMCKNVKGLAAVATVLDSLVKSLGDIPYDWPILGVMVWKIRDFTEGFSTGNLKDKFLEKDQPWKIPVRFHENVLNSLDRDKCLRVVAHRYDLSVEDILRAEETIHQAPIPGVICHPVLTQIISHDY